METSKLILPLEKNLVGLERLKQSGPEFGSKDRETLGAKYVSVTAAPGRWQQEDL